MEFDSDLFISYAHIDDQALVEGQKGWISDLHRVLEIRLAQLVGRPPRIWRDPKLSGNDVFSDQLVDRVGGVALLLSVLSPRYVNSDWCTRELRVFLEATAKSGGPRIGDKIRVFKVVKTQIPLEQHPPELQEVLGYDFFVVDPETGRARELSQTSDREDRTRYFARLDDLAYDITEALGLIENSGAAIPAATAGGERPAVYLAETTFDLKGERDSIKRELAGHGYQVLPDRPLPLVAAESEALVREQLERCTLSVHLIGRNYGIVPEGATESQAVLQNEVAIERGMAGDFVRLIWMPPGLETEDERQLRFIDSLQTDPRIQDGADILEISLEDLKSAIHRKLEPPEEEEEDGALDDGGGLAPGDELSRIYLICDQRDLDHTLALEDYLFDQGYEVIVPVFEGDEAQVRKDHEENLVVCDAILFYYGAANELWLRRKLREVQKSAAYGRTRPLRAKAIYVAPPATPQKRRVRTREALVIPQQQDFEPSVLKPFLAQLGVP